MPFATNKGGFQYNFTRQNEFEQLRQKNILLERENYQLRSSLEELLQVHEQLTLRFQQLQAINHEGQNTEQMQRKIDLLTQQVDTLRREIQDVHYKKAKSSNRRDSQLNSQENQRTEEVVQILQQLTQSFQNVQVNYQQQIEQLQSELNMMKNQGNANFKKLQQQYNQKIHTFEDVIIQLKRKDEIVTHIEQKLKVSEDTLKAIIEGSLSQRNQSNTVLKNYNGIAKAEHNHQTGSKFRSEQKQKLLNEIEQKDRIIQTYRQLIFKLKQKLEEKI